MKPIAVEPDNWRKKALEEAVKEGGGKIAPIAEAEGLIFSCPENPPAIEPVLKDAQNLKWVQLPWAGIEPYLDHLNNDFLWTCGKGVYAPAVAEHTLAMLLSAFRGLNTYIPKKEWSEPIGKNLIGAKIVILGGGGIASELVKLLYPFGAEISIVRRHKQPLEDEEPELGLDKALESAKIFTLESALDILPGKDAIVVAWALTPETQGFVDYEFFKKMDKEAWMVNVGRGQHVITEDLVKALEEKQIAGAALDVVDPEPLDAGHPLWNMPNCIITPHIANTPEMGIDLLCKRTVKNVQRFCAGEEPLGKVNTELGY